MATKRPTNLRQNLPVLWLMTDERLGGQLPGDPLWRAVRRLPRGAGIVFRHYGWPQDQRRALLKKLVLVARRRGLVLIGSGIAAPNGVHRPGSDRMARGRGLITASAHDRAEMLAAARRGAHLVFLSPVFATASHPDSRTLGPMRFGLAARHAPVPVIALGGMNRQRARRLQPLGAAGFAAIGWWARP